MKKITPSDGMYAQSPIMGRMAFSFVSEDGTRQIGNFTGCREAISGLLPHALIEHPTYKSISREKLRVLVAWTNDDALESHLESAMNWLHQVERELGLIRSSFERVEGFQENLGQIFLVEGSSRWLLSPPMFSVFLFALRNGVFHEKGEKWDTLFSKIRSQGVLNDHAWAQNCADAVKFIIKNKYWKVFGKDMKENWPNDGRVPFIGLERFTVDTRQSFAKPNAIFQHWMFPKEMQ